MSPRARTAGATLRRTEYASGLRIITEAMPEMRSIALGVWVDVGSRDERPDIAGTSHFLEHLLFKGTKRRTAQDIAEAFDAVGGDLNAFSAKEYTCYYCRVLDRDLPMAVDFMGDMIQNSLIATSDVEAERGVILEEINMRDDDPGDLIHDLFAETLWSGHPLGRPVLGTRETIGSVSRDQVRRFYKKRYAPPRFVVAAAGNLDHDPLCALVEGALDAGKRMSENSRPNVRGGGSVPEVSRATLVRKRKTEQAHICYGTSGFSRRDPDRFALGVVNTALGGGMSSRLFQEVREKRGLAYSVGSVSLVVRRDGAVLRVRRHGPVAGARDARDRPRADRRDGREGPDDGRARPREGPHEGLAGALARGHAGPDVADRQVRDRARRDPVGGRGARADRRGHAPATRRASPPTSSPAR